MEYRRNDIDISQFLPPVSRDSQDIQEVMRIENPEFKLLWDIMADILDNQFIPTMGEFGLSHWEWILDVLPQDTDTIEDRRNRILRLLAGTRPYTVEKLQEMLDATFGTGSVGVDLNENQYEIWFILSKEMRERSGEVINYAEPIVPKNLLLKTLVEDKTQTKLNVGGGLYLVDKEITILKPRNYDISTTIYNGGALASTTIEITRR
jgi:phage-like element PBSX protein xkdU